MTTRLFRCAIYTRKSSEEGLEKNFNSLHAQREACSAYIESQKHEGWKLLSTPYDDGGYSGGNTDRPALRRLLADVDAGALDLVVVYKVDRLTRALTDFAKIVERFEAKGVSFVSVTQAFNTTTSKLCIQLDQDELRKVLKLPPIAGGGINLEYPICLYRVGNDIRLVIPAPRGQPEAAKIDSSPAVDSGTSS